MPVRMSRPRVCRPWLSDWGETTEDKLSALFLLGSVEFAVDVEKDGTFPSDGEHAELSPSIQRAAKKARKKELMKSKR